MIDEIVVTGTALRTAAIDSPYAVQSLDRDAIADQGAPALVDLFKNFGPNTGAIGELTSWLNGAGQAVAETVANVNLRGLGASRTLVLFNGRRQTYVPARLIGGRYVDVNVIPVIALERIDLLKEGAAAVYGSDAIAGVVNFITRDGFEGFEGAASYEHFAGAGDAGLSAIWGGRIGRSELMLAAEYQRREALNITERDWALPADGDAYWGWSGVGNPGAFMVTGASIPELPFSQTLLLAPRFVDPACAGMGGENWGNRSCAFRFSPWDNLIEEQRQTRIFGQLQGEWGDSGEFHLEALWSEAVIPGWLTTPSSPPVIRYDNTQLVRADHPGRVAFVKAYPRLPGSDGVVMDLTGDEDWYFFGRMIGSSGPGRTVPRDSRTVRLAAALSDSPPAFARLGMHYDIGLSWSRSEALMNRPAEYSYRRFLAFRGYGGADCGVSVTTHPGRPADLILGPVPAGVRPGAGNCLYYNPFGNAIEHSAQPGAAFENSPNPDFEPSLANSPALFDWIREEVRLNSRTELLAFDAVLRGEREDWLAGYAAGYQFRRFKASGQPNDPANLALNPCWLPGDRGCANQTGLFSSAKGFLPYEADQSTHALFAELALTFRDRLNLQLASRYEIHEHTETFDPKLAARLDLTDSLALRGSVQTAFRAPSVDGLSTDITTRLELLPAVGTFKAIETQGNPDLEPESALAVNAGLFVQTQGGLEAALEYWRFALDDPVIVLPFRAIESRYADPATRAAVQQLVFCPGNRNDGSCSAGEIERVRVYHVNGPTINVSGLDLRISGLLELAFGSVHWGAEASWFLDYEMEAITYNGVTLRPAVKVAGYLNDPVDGALPPAPRWKGRVFGGIERDSFRLSGYFNHVTSYRDRERVTGTRYAEIGAFSTLDLILLWQPPGRALSVTFSALNLTDEDPPLIGSDHFFDGMTHNPKRRRLKLALRYRLPPG